MHLTTPNWLTIGRIAIIPVFVFLYYYPIEGGRIYATALFIFAAITDWLDGYLARRLHQTSNLGAFLDPVADKLIVITALVLLVGDLNNSERVIHQVLFTCVAIIIIAREIVISALREWMAKVGDSDSVKVSMAGKIKTFVQMLAIILLIYRDDLFGIPIFKIGEYLLYVAAALTLWSLVVYWRSAWPNLAPDE